MRSVARSYRRKVMNGIPGLKEAAMRNLHLNDDSWSRLRFLPLLVLTELRWDWK